MNHGSSAGGSSTTASTAVAVGAASSKVRVPELARTTSSSLCETARTDHVNGPSAGSRRFAGVQRPAAVSPDATGAPWRSTMETANHSPRDASQRSDGTSTVAPSAGARRSIAGASTVKLRTADQSVGSVCQRPPRSFPPRARTRQWYVPPSARSSGSGALEDSDSVPASRTVSSANTVLTPVAKLGSVLSWRTYPVRRGTGTHAIRGTPGTVAPSAGPRSAGPASRTTVTVRHPDHAEWNGSP